MNPFQNEVAQIAVGDDQIAVLTLEMPGRANVIGEGFLRGLTAALDWLAANPVKGLILRSGHKDFCAGADLDLLYPERDAARLLEGVRAFHAVHRRLEQGPPVVSCAAPRSAAGTSSRWRRTTGSRSISRRRSSGSPR